jgi:hypothetical protein
MPARRPGPGKGLSRLVVGPGDHRVIDFQQHFVSGFGVPLHRELLCCGPMLHRLPNRTPHHAEKSSAKFGIAPNIGPDFWAANPELPSFCNDSNVLFFLTNLARPLQLKPSG